MVPANNKNRLPIFAIFALLFFVCICPASFSIVKSERQNHDDQSTAAAELELATEKQPWLGAGRSRIVACLSIVIVSLVGNVLGGLSIRMFGDGKSKKVLCSLIAQTISVSIGYKIGYGCMIGAVIGQNIGLSQFGLTIGKLFAVFGYKKGYGQLLGFIFGTWIGLEMGWGCMCCALIGCVLGIGFGTVIGPLLLESIGNVPPIDDNLKLIQLELCKEIGMAIGTVIGLLIRLLFVHYGFVFTICLCILAALYCAS